MKKIVTVVAVLAGIIALITAVVGVCLYMKDIVRIFTTIKDKFLKKSSTTDAIFED